MDAVERTLTNLASTMKPEHQVVAGTITYQHYD